MRYNTDRLKTCEECFRDEIVAHINKNKEGMLESITKMRGDCVIGGWWLLVFASITIL